MFRNSLSLSFLLLLALTFGTRFASAQVKWDLSTVWPESNFHTKNQVRFAQEVAKATGQEVQIVVHAGGALGFKGPEHLRAVRDGLVPMADVLTTQQVGDEPMFGIDSIPFLVNSIEQLRIFHKYARPEYEKISARNNQKILYMVPWPASYLHAKVKSNTLAGLKGVKVRVPEKNSADMLNALGMAGVLIPWGETIPALASGAVSGVLTSASSAVDGRFWEFLKYVYPVHSYWPSSLVTVNLQAWSKLKPEHRKAIEGISKRLEPEFWNVSIQDGEVSLKKLTNNGMELLPVSPAMRQEIQTRSAPLMESFIKRVPQAEPIVRAYLAEAKK